MEQRLKIVLSKLDSMAAVHAVEKTLSKIDRRLIDHGGRVAYIAERLRSFGHLPLDPKTLFLLAVFHDVGAYKTEEIDRMVEFETENVQDHAVYGYLFLKYMSPLKESAEAILYHHSSWEQTLEKGLKYRDYADLLHLCDRIDIAAAAGENSEAFRALWENRAGLFRPEYVELFCRLYRSEDLFSVLANGEHHEANFSLCETLSISAQEAVDFLKMIVFTIDFRSEHTVTHSINTISISLNIARYFGCSDEEIECIYLGSLLHDVGKVAIPFSILESTGKLSDADMELMRTHVVETERLIRGAVPEEVFEIAIRHHEKLDGSGYPHALLASELSFPQRIVAVADIVSALSSCRSYKDPFPKEKTLAILEEMAQSKLDPVICRYVCENYDAIVADTEVDRQKVISDYQSIRREFEQLSADC